MQVLQYHEVAEPRSPKLSVWLTEGIWKCPAANLAPPWPTNSLYMSYGYNGLGLNPETDATGLGLGGHLLSGGGSAHTTSARARESEVGSPSEMMAIGAGFEGGGGVIRDGQMILCRYESVPNEYYAGGTKRAYALHQRGANVVFCDGHVASPSLHLLFANTSDATLCRWNRDHLPHRGELGPWRDEIGGQRSQNRSHIVYRRHATLERRGNKDAGAGCPRPVDERNFVTE